MVSKTDIVELVNTFSMGLPSERVPERVQTLGDIELEIKIGISSLGQLDKILKRVLQIGVSKFTHRHEEHHFFSSDGVGHGVLVLVDGSNEVWIKIKKDHNLVKTPTQGFTLLSRHEIKHTPRHETYSEDFLATVSQPYIGSFDKECIDLSFYYMDLSFTVTLSLADSKSSSLYQIEFEYDGHKTGENPPDIHRILEVFEEMLVDVCGDETDRLTTHTKIEWLASLR